MPAVFFGPQPTAFAHLQDKLKNIGVALTVYHPLFDIEDE